jgi:hypothetical protein
MKNLHRAIALATLVALAAVPLAAAADLSGTWTMTATTPRGERTSTLTFVQEGEKLTVTSKSERGESTGAGTIKGDAIEWSITRETPMGPMTVTYKGTVAGDTMSGEAMMRDQPMPWKAVRAQ